jgi:hypothetical protein
MGGADTGQGKGVKGMLNPTDSIIVRLWPSYLEDYYIHIPKKELHLFPKPPKEIEIEDNSLTFKAHIISDSNGSVYIGRFLKLFQAHQELKAGEKVRIATVESKRKYHIEKVL